MPGRNFNPGTTKYGFNGKREDEEIYGEGNAYDFGARMYDPRIGRWLSIDPEFKQYPFLSPYSGFANNPIYFIDPEGETLRVAEGVDRVKVQAALQKLTNDKVEILKDGTVKLTANNQNPGKKLINGTQLLRDVAGHNRTTEIFKFGEGPISHSSPERRGTGNEYNGVGIDTYVIIGKDIPILEVNPKTGKTSYQLDSKEISVAVELIHSLKAMDGKQRKDEWIQENDFIDPNGIPRTEIQSREELETHGLGGTENIKKDGTRYVNEQDIRSEQKRNPRANYTTGWNTNSEGESYKSDQKRTKK